MLAHGFCNMGKSDALPGDRYVEQLVNRNEHLIMSNHPLKGHIMMQLGSTPDQRQRSVVRVYADANQVIPTVWSQLRGYDPGSDLLLKAIVRSQNRNQSSGSATTSSCATASPRASRPKASAAPGVAWTRRSTSPGPTRS